MEQEQHENEPYESSSSSSDLEEENGVPAAFYGGYEMLDMEEASDMDEDLALDYTKLVEQEGLQYTLKSVPLGSRLKPFASSLGFVEKLLVLRPLNINEIVDIDTLVVLDDHRVLGKVLEVFGPIDNPLYSVLCHAEFVDQHPLPTTNFNYLPDQTSIVQTAALRAQKCTDAEEGEEFYSDDEAEAEAKRNRAPKRKADIEPGEIEE